MGKGERDGEKNEGAETSLQGSRDNKADDYATRDDWIEGIFQMGNVEGLNGNEETPPNKDNS